MPLRNLGKFYLSIVLPSVLAMVLFIISFYLIVIPMFEKNMMDRKKEMILELTNTAWSILDENYTAFSEQKVSEAQAKQNAAKQIELMRYGPERKDYFWIIDHEPRMVMHPYRKELNNQNLTDYKDSHNNRLFVDAVKLVNKKHEGFIEYYWQWKDDTTRVVPKLSYVKSFKPWGWIIGTGIYLEDVKQELAELRKRLFRISIYIAGVIFLILIYIIRQSLELEKKRAKAEQGLMLSRQKYKSLVEASTEGTLMLVENKVIFANMKFAKLLGATTEQFVNQSIEEIFNISWDELNSRFKVPNKSVSLEANVPIAGALKKSIVISASKVDYSEKHAVIIVAKEITAHKQVEIEGEKLNEALQQVFLSMNQPLALLMKKCTYCDIGTPVKEAARLMTNHKTNTLFVRHNQKIIGVVNDKILRERALTLSNSNENTVELVMSSPVHSISGKALVPEAIFKMGSSCVNELLVVSNHKILGYVSYHHCLEAQINLGSQLLEEIAGSYQVSEIKSVYNRLPAVIHQLMESGSNIEIVTRLISQVADHITKRVIELNIGNFGKPPCKFAFFVLGSEGREEQTLKTDQDNAIVYEQANESNQHFFLMLAKQINHDLNTIGYKFCEGNNMAGNPKWCQPLEIWKKYFTSWAKSPEPQSVLDSSIFFDLRCVYGEQHLVDQLYTHIDKATEQNALFFHHLASAVTRFKPAIEKNILNIKKLTMPVTGYLRVFALLNNVHTPNGLERLNKLAEIDVFTGKKQETIKTLHTYLTRLRVKHQVKQILSNNPPDNLLNMHNCNVLQDVALKKIISEIHLLQSELASEFKTGG